MQNQIAPTQIQMHAFCWIIVHLRKLFAQKNQSQEWGDRRKTAKIGKIMWKQSLRKKHWNGNELFVSFRPQHRNTFAIFQQFVFRETFFLQNSDKRTRSWSVFLPLKNRTIDLKRSLCLCDTLWHSQSQVNDRYFDRVKKFDRFEWFVTYER